MLLRTAWRLAPIRLGFMLLCYVAFGACSANRFTVTSSADPAKLDGIFEEYFEAYLKLFPTFASEIGDHRYDDQLEIAIGEDHIARQKKLAAGTLAQLDQVDASQLDGARQLSLSLLRYNLEDVLEGLKFPQPLLPVRQLASLAVEFPLLASVTGHWSAPSVGLITPLGRSSLKGIWR